ncbi:MAG TPA: glycosyltransferase, partial [Caulobacterales bacterium]|nr:glycosyltransferase [Caulobacterales bacterium]
VVGECVPSLELCLRGVLGEPWVDELILVDSGAPKALASSLRALQADRRDVRFIQTKKGPLPTHAAARNVGADRAMGKWLLFLDADIVLQRGAVERLVKAGRLARSPWIVGGGLSDPNGRKRHVPGRSLIGRRPAPVELVDEAFLLVPRAEFHALGGFDEAYGLHGETADLCRRAKDSGGAVWHQPVAEAVQFAGSRAANLIADQVQRARAKARYERKFARTEFARAMVSVWAPLLIAASAAKGALMAPLKSLAK